MMGNLFRYKNFIDANKDDNKKKNNRFNQENENILLDENNIKSTNKNQFERFDTYSGLFNTQQLIGSVDFSEFRNHCFFDSAVSKVEYSFNNIYDNFPLDGVESELNDFLRNMDGFGKFIYNNIDKNIGYLKFDGNNYIEVTNRSGYLFALKRNEQIIQKISTQVLNPANKNFSFDFRLFINNEGILENLPVFQYAIPDFNADNQINGFTFFIKEITNVGSKLFAKCVFLFNISKYKNNEMIAVFLVNINEWQHICISISNSESQNNKEINVYVNSIKLNLKNTNIDSSVDNYFKVESAVNNLNFDIDTSANFLIGNAVLNHQNNFNSDLNFISGNKLKSAYIDEFRFYHKELDIDYIIFKREENEYANNFLKLYFKFNEPAGVYSNNSICFDSSGNSLHSKIVVIDNNVNLSGGNLRNYIDSLRYNGASPFVDKNNIKIKPSLKFEKDDYNPVLFPTFTKNKLLNDAYIEKAKEWDLNNSNLIFKLFPKHYFDDGSLFEGLGERFNNQNAKTYYIDDETLPGEQRTEAIQTFANLLIIWARFFDEIKLYLDIMPKLIDIDYNDISSNESTINFFLPLMAKKSGFEFKEIISNPTNKILDGYILGQDGIDKSQLTLRYIQNEMWKRILVNSRDILMSKGTKSAIKSIFNSIGINYDNFYTFREFGKQISAAVENKRYIKRSRNFKLLKFSNNTVDNNFFLEADLSHLINDFKPTLNNKQYTFEFLIDFSNNLNRYSSTDNSIFKLVNQSNQSSVYFELFYIKNVQDELGTLTLRVKNYNSTNSDIIIDEINLINKMFKIFIKIENFSSPSNINNRISLICSECGINRYSKSSFLNFKSSDPSQPKIFIENTTKTILVGSPSSISRQFTGNISDIRLWNCNLSDDDIEMHCLDFFSISNNLYLSYSKISDLLLFHLSCQDDSVYTYNSSLEKRILLIDFSEKYNALPNFSNQSTYPFRIKTFLYNTINLVESCIIEKEIINNEINVKFDEQNIENKVNIASYQDLDLALKNKKALVPVHEVNYFNQKRNDIRFSIEMSNVKHLNEDIAKLFSDIFFQTNNLSDFGSMNEPIYNTFEKFSDFYFKRIKSDKIQITPLYEIYQIFDNILTEMLSEFVSSRVKFNNNVYVIESHVLERHKYYYKFAESHLKMSGDMSISSIHNSKKSRQYLDMRKQ